MHPRARGPPYRRQQDRLVDEEPRIESAVAHQDEPRESRIYPSAKTGAGLELLRHELLAIAGWQPSARPRSFNNPVVLEASM